MGIIKSSENRFGLKAAGIIQRIGVNVTYFKAGDRVMLVPNCLFPDTHRVVSENLCEKFPSGLSFENAATIPCVFAISIYSPFSVRNLKKS